MQVQQNALPAMMLSLMFLVGCGSYESAPPPPKPAAETSPKPAEQKPVPNPTAEFTPKPAAPAEQKPPETVVKKAEVGMGAKGHYDGPGFVTTPVATFFRVRERIAFDIQVPHAMDLFKATEGHAPRTQEEFMQRIIKENNINLPQLLPEESYLYDPKTEQLMIRQPARQ